LGGCIDFALTYHPNGGLMEARFDHLAEKAVRLARFDHGALIQRLPLTLEQCHAVSTWLDLHRPGWSSSPVTFAPAVLVSLRHEDSTTTTLDVFPTFVVVAHEGSQFTRNVSAKDTTELKRLLGLPSDG